MAVTKASQFLRERAGSLGKMSVERAKQIVPLQAEIDDIRTAMEAEDEMAAQYRAAAEHLEKAGM